MKKIISILALSIFLFSCSPEEEEIEQCDCKTKTYVNGVFSGEQTPYSTDCNDDDTFINAYSQDEYYVVKTVECD